MVADYKLRFRDTSDVLQAEVVDFLRLGLTMRVNLPGTLTWRLSGEHRILDDIGDKWEVEAWRRAEGQEWERHLVAQLRDEDWRGDERGLTRFDGVAPGLMSLLGRRIVNWDAGTNLRSQFVNDPAETIAKLLVDYNAGPNATAANGRKRTGTIDEISVEADGGGGNSKNWYAHGDNLLETLPKLARVGGGDYDLVKVAAGDYEFRWFDGQLGTDRTATVVFSLLHGNMGNPRYRALRSGEKTVACVWGQGHGSQRDYVDRQGANFAADNDIEMYVDAKDIDQGDTSSLEDRGDEKLAEVEAKEEFEFDVLQTPATRFGEHYELGDLVTAVNPFTGVASTQKIVAVTMVIDEDGNEAIAVETETPPS